MAVTATPEKRIKEAIALHESGELSKAEDLYKTVLNEDPENADANQLLGILHHQRDDNERAAELIQRAVEAQPENPNFAYNLGVVQFENGHADEAEACYRKVLQLDPGYLSAWVNLGNLLQAKGAFAESYDCCRNTLKLQPDSAEHFLRAGNTLRLIGDIEGALAHLGMAVSIDPANLSAGSALLLASQYQAGITAEQLKHRHSDWAARIATVTAPDSNNSESSNEPEPRLKSLRPSSNSDDGGLRVGFVSPDFGNHPVGIFVAPVLDRLKEREDIQAICYSDSTKEDEYAQRNRAAAGEWHDVTGLDDQALTSKIRGDRIDVLFDLTGHTENNRLGVFARKPAAVQMTWAGYVGTTGLEAIDYILTDPFHTPEGFEEFYAETPLRLPRDYICYEAPAYAPEPGPLPLLENGYPTFGCLNNPSKISIASVALWSGILHGIPDSRLLLKYKGMDDPSVKLRILGLFAVHGIFGDRIEFHGQTTHVEHLKFFDRIDVTLDPTPYSSGLSACESLWMGVPVITLPGDTFASRHSLSHLMNAGITGTIAKDAADYLEIARQLIADPAELATVRNSMRDQVGSSILCDLDGYANDFVAALTQVTSTED